MVSTVAWTYRFPPMISDSTHDNSGSPLDRTRRSSTTNDDTADHAKNVNGKYTSAYKGPYICDQHGGSTGMYEEGLVRG